MIENFLTGVYLLRWALLLGVAIVAVAVAIERLLELREALGVRRLERENTRLRVELARLRAHHDACRMRVASAPPATFGGQVRTYEQNGVPR